MNSAAARAITPKTPRTSRCFTLEPPTNIMMIPIAQIMIVPERWGWSIISRTTIPRQPRNGTIPYLKYFILE